MDQTEFSIRELCDEFGVTSRALRFYESQELLSPARDGQRRIFSASDRARLKLILRGKRFGFSLNEIRELLDLYKIKDGGVLQLRSTLQTAYQKREELAARLDDVKAALSELDEQIKLGEAMLTERERGDNEIERSARSS